VTFATFTETKRHRGWFTLADWSYLDALDLSSELHALSDW